MQESNETASSSALKKEKYKITLTFAYLKSDQTLVLHACLCDLTTNGQTEMFYKLECGVPFIISSTPALDSSLTVMSNYTKLEIGVQTLAVKNEPIIMLLCAHPLDLQVDLVKLLKSIPNSRQRKIWKHARGKNVYCTGITLALPKLQIKSEELDRSIVFPPIKELKEEDICPSFDLVVPSSIYDK